MEHFNRANNRRLMRDIGRHKERYDKDVRDPMRFAKLVMKYALPIDRNESRIGVLDFNDVLQNAFLGLLEGWKNIDWDKVENADNRDKTIANFLSARIIGSIKRENFKTAVGVKIPEREITKTIKEEVAERIFGNWMFNFKLDDHSPGTMLRYIDLIEDREEPYRTHMLNAKLSGMLHRLPAKQRKILDWSFGLNLDNKMSIRDIADELNMSEIGVKKAKARALDKLRDDPYVLKELESFL